MYFTAMTFDLHSPMTYRFLDNPECAHAEILSLFPSDAPRPLFRVDETKNGKIVYLVSDSMPDTARWNNRFAMRRDADLCKTAEYDKFLQSMKPGNSFAFRITAVPSKTVDGKKKSLNYFDALAWITRKTHEHGADIIEGTLRQVGEESVKFKKKPTDNASICYTSRTYEGILTVADPQRFREMLVHGLGRQKAYGCGLMTVAAIK